MDEVTNSVEETAAVGCMGSVLAVLMAGSVAMCLGCGGVFVWLAWPRAGLDTSVAVHGDVEAVFRWRSGTSDPGVRQMLDQAVETMDRIDSPDTPDWLRAHQRTNIGVMGSFLPTDIYVATEGGDGPTILAASTEGWGGLGWLLSRFASWRATAEGQGEVRWREGVRVTETSTMAWAYDDGTFLMADDGDTVEAALRRRGQPGALPADLAALTAFVPEAADGWMAMSEGSLPTWAAADLPSSAEGAAGWVDIVDGDTVQFALQVRCPTDKASCVQALGALGRRYGEQVTETGASWTWDVTTRGDDAVATGRIDGIAKAMEAFLLETREP